MEEYSEDKIYKSKAELRGSLILIKNSKNSSFFRLACYRYSWTLEEGSPCFSRYFWTCGRFLFKPTLWGKRNYFQDGACGIHKDRLIISIYFTTQGLLYQLGLFEKKRSLQGPLKSKRRYCVAWHWICLQQCVSKNNKSYLCLHRFPLNLTSYKHTKRYLSLFLNI